MPSVKQPLTGLSACAHACSYCINVTLQANYTRERPVDESSMRGRYNMAPDTAIDEVCLQGGGGVGVWGDILCSSAATDWITLCNGSLARVSQILLACVSNVHQSQQPLQFPSAFLLFPLYQLLARGTARGGRQTPFQIVAMMMGR